MEASKLKEILEKHKMWLNGEEGGERADLCVSNLYEASLRGVDLSYAHFRGAILREANLKGIGTSKIKDIVSQVSDNRAELLWLGQKHGILILDNN